MMFRCIALVSSFPLDHLKGRLVVNPLDVLVGLLVHEAVDGSVCTLGDTFLGHEAVGR